MIADARRRFAGRDLPALVLLSVVVLAVFGPLTAYLIVRERPFFDYFTHLELARRMAGDFTLRSPHFLFQLLVIALQAIAGGYTRAAAVVIIASHLILAVILFRAVRPSAGGSLTAALCTLALMLVTPIPLLAPVDAHVYFGYLSAGSVYHNPTILLLKPLTILLFVWSFRFFTPPFRSNIKTIVAIAVVVFLSAITKPSYLICLLPALSLIAFLRVVRKEPIDWRGLVLGVMIPATAILGWQYLQNYTTGTSSIALAPFLVARYYSDWLLPKFLLSIAFPLAVTLLFFRRAIADVRMQLAWIGAILGAFCFYFVIEIGPDRLTFHGNFGWSGIITFFVLFVASLMFLLEQWRDDPAARSRLMLSTAIFALHAISGVWWYALSWQGKAYW